CGIGRVGVWKSAGTETSLECVISDQNDWARLTLAARAARVDTSSFWNEWRRWLFTVCGEMNRRLPTARLVRPSATSSATERSLFVRLSHPVPHARESRGCRAARR